MPQLPFQTCKLLRRAIWNAKNKAGSLFLANSVLNATIAGCPRAPLLSNEGLRGASCGAEAEISDLKRLQDVSGAARALQVFVQRKSGAAGM